MTIRLGSTGAQVREVQILLTLPPTGRFGAAEDTAVRKFQAAHRLIVDGIVGPITLTALRNAATPYIRAVANSMLSVAGAPAKTPAPSAPQDQQQQGVDAGKIVLYSTLALVVVSLPAIISRLAK